jgi:hypothetical protein
MRPRCGRGVILGPRDIQSLEIFNDSPAPMYNVYVDEQYYQQNTNSKLKAPNTNRPIKFLRKSRPLVGPSIVNPRERATLSRIHVGAVVMGFTLVPSGRQCSMATDQSR